MSGYAQPAEYKFSHDSIELAQRAVEFLSGPDAKILDLCAGCGVVGLELAKILQARRSEVLIRARFDFLEVQSVYREFFEKNRASLGLESSARWLEMNYADLTLDLGAEDIAGVYDLVVSNPPYFDREQGSLPPSDFKARCRFFLDSDFETMWKAILRVLKPGGNALVLVRDLSDHGLDRVSALDRILSSHGVWKEKAPIRGTGLVHFQKA